MSRADQIRDWIHAHRVLVLVALAVLVVVNVGAFIWAIVADNWYTALVMMITAFIIVGLLANETQEQRERSMENMFDDDYE